MVFANSAGGVERLCGRTSSSMGRARVHGAERLGDSVNVFGKTRQSLPS